MMREFNLMMIRSIFLKTLAPQYSWNIVESGVKHHKSTNIFYIDLQNMWLYYFFLQYMWFVTCSHWGM
jgi:hypothetical protein